MSRLEPPPMSAVAGPLSGRQLADRATSLQWCKVVCAGDPLPRDLPVLALGRIRVA